jgi:glycerophosphoryl diester phosphodiesterase
MRRTATLDALLRAPIAHRGLHDAGAGRPENSFAAVDAAVAAGFGVEVDVRRSRDGVPMVFHDATLRRLGGRPERVRDLTAGELAEVSVGDGERVPRLVDVLRRVDGRVPVLIDAKTKPGEHAAMAGAIAHAIACYAGPVAVTSFDAFMLRLLAPRAPQVVRGLSGGVPHVGNVPVLRALGSPVDDLWLQGYCRPQFICFNLDRLPSAAVSTARAAGRPVIGWTARTAAQAAASAALVDNLIVEGPLAAALVAPQRLTGLMSA